MKGSSKVAIVCDWLVGVGGAERVVYELHKLYPQAPIYTSQYKHDDKVEDWFSKADVRTLWLQRLPGFLRKFSPVLRAWAFGRLDLSGYDLVISSSGAEAKAVKTGKNTIHITYCHAPTHYYWSRYEQYKKHPGFGIFNPLAKLGLIIFVRPMRKWDFKAAQKPDYFIANSNHTKEQIKKYYGRDSVVIHPPVDIERFKPKAKQLEKHGFLIAGRQTPYKRFDLAVAACSQLDVPLKVIGNGPQHRKLVAMAGPRVTFLTKISDKEMPWHFQQAAAFIFPGVDDFGIVAVETLAAGTPVIAYKAGGALDYVVNRKNGILFDEQSVSSLVESLKSFNHKTFQPSNVSKSANEFSASNFRVEIQKFIDHKLATN